jgi:outer membrane protein assembly factor BamB
VLIVGAFPGTAAAQLPDLPPLPGLPPVGGSPQPPHPPKPPSQQPPAAGARGSFGDVVTYRTNPQSTGFTRDDSAFGPLYRLWSKRFRGPASTPLITRGRVMANVANSDTSYGSRVVAFDLRTGRRVWSRRTPGTYYSSHIAIDGGRLVALNTEGVMRAFAVANGRPLWTFHPPGNSFSLDSVPVAAGGTAYFVAEHTDSSNTYLYAVAMRTGVLRWKRLVPVDYGHAQPALDSRRVYALDTCGRAIALRRSDGSEVWPGRRASCSRVASSRPVATVSSTTRPAAHIAGDFPAARRTPR